MADANTVTIWSDWEAGWFVRTPAFAEECIDSAGEALMLALGRKKLDEDETRLAPILDAFYASEFNARVSCNVDGTRWKGEIGDHWNGFKESRDGLSLPALLDRLPAAACRAHPDSNYAKRFRPN